MTLSRRTDRDTRNLFVVIEGLDGTGKSSVADDVAAGLQATGRPAVAVHTPQGEYQLITKYISDKCAVDAQFLFFLSAVKHTSDLVARSRETTTIVCDRYIYSTLAYHRARGAGVSIDVASLQLQQPDHAFYLTVTDETVRNDRVQKRGVAKPGDLLPLKTGLLEAIDRQFKEFPLTIVDTTHLLQHEVVRTVLDAIE